MTSSELHVADSAPYPPKKKKQNEDKHWLHFQLKEAKESSAIQKLLLFFVLDKFAGKWYGTRVDEGECAPYWPGGVKLLDIAFEFVFYKVCKNKTKKSSTF